MDGSAGLRSCKFGFGFGVGSCSHLNSLHSFLARNLQKLSLLLPSAIIILQPGHRAATPALLYSPRLLLRSIYHSTSRSAP